MELFGIKGRGGSRGMRVAPRCRGAASSLLRLSRATDTELGYGHGLVAVQRLVQSAAALTGRAKTDMPVPLYTRLWPSVSFGHEALWQDTLVVLD